MISRTKGFIFVHIPKTAGNAVQGALLPYADDRLVLDPAKHQDGVERFDLHDPEAGTRKHSTIADYAAALDAEFFERALKMAVVRNPWDRCISYYFFDNRMPPYTGGETPPEPTFDAETFLQAIRTYPRYRESVCLRGVFGRHQPIERHRLSRVLRFETLQSDFDATMDTLCIPRVELARRNATYHRHYTEYYTERTRRAVRDRFAEDIEYFDYEFGRA